MLSSIFLMDIDDLKPGDSFTERELYEMFNVRNGGGIRPSLRNELVILITSTSTMDYGQKNYKDEVDSVNQILSYTGEGKQNQQMTRNNKSILNSQYNGFRLLYFIKSSPNHLVFKSKVKYDSHCNKTQVNSEGHPREVIVFKLKIL